MDFNYQYIDWEHDPIIDENYNFHHLGTLSATILSPSIMVGLTDWWNISFRQVLGKRYMSWESDSTSKHHRDEGSDSDYENAVGGYLGDSKLMIRYLLMNAGKGPGVRLFFGGGVIIPSKNVLKSSPFYDSDSIVEDHRHFSMSEGVKKAIFETQFYIKRMANPVFIGGTLIIEEPLGKSDYGFQASRLIDLSITAFTRKIKYLDGSMGGSFMVRSTNKAYWNGKEAPNSESVLLIPGIGILWNLKFGTVMLNMQKPTFLKGSLSGTAAYLDEETDVWQISLSIRKTLDYYISWLYW